MGQRKSPDEKKAKKAAAKPSAGIRTRGQRTGDVGRSLRSVYDETRREDVPDDFLNLLGKLN